MNKSCPAAELYARRGWKVFPLAPRTKRPHSLAPHGFHDATADLDQIHEWWTRAPTAGVAIACRPSGLLVIDIDPRHGGDETFRNLQRHHGPLPETLWQRTPSGGWHCIFLHPDLERVIGSLGDGVDVKSNGYIVAAPSIHPSGGTYQLHNWPTAPAPVPGWLPRLLAPPIEHPTRSVIDLSRLGSLDRFSAAAVQGEVDRVTNAQPGLRNMTLNRASFALGQLVGAGLLAEDVVRRTLTAAADACGLPSHEAARTITSGLEAGRRHPRVVRP